MAGLQEESKNIEGGDQAKKRMENCQQLEKKLGDGVAWLRGAMIGKGSFGCVYLATLKKPRSRHGCLPQVMAVKSAEVSVSGTIQKEKEVLSNVNGCPCIIRCFGEETTFGENGEMVYNLLLEYGSGGTLAGLIKKSRGNAGLMPEFQAKRHARSILRGLCYIHEFGYVHCDLKPENVLLVPNSRGGVNGFQAKIGDFGLAKRGKQSKKRKLDPYWRGTPMYLSPEAVVDRVQKAPADIWALGCIVLEMLTGKPPWSDSEPKDILCRIGEGNESPEIPNEVSKEGKSFLKGCFVRKPMYRWTTEMLLHHPFLEGLHDDDDEFVECAEALDVNEICTTLLLSDSGDEPVWSSYCNGEESCSYLSDEYVVGLDDELYSSFGEEGTSEVPESREVLSTNIDSDFDCVSKTSRKVSSKLTSNTFQQYPISYRIPAGV